MRRPSRDKIARKPNENKVESVSGVPLAPTMSVYSVKGLLGEPRRRRGFCVVGGRDRWPTTPSRQFMSLVAARLPRRSASLFSKVTLLLSAPRPRASTARTPTGRAGRAGCCSHGVVPGRMALSQHASASPRPAARIGNAEPSFHTPEQAGACYVNPAPRDIAHDGARRRWRG
jgi:hypothetical protein